MDIKKFSKQLIATAAAGTIVIAALVVLGVQCRAQGNVTVTNELSAQAQAEDAKRKGKPRVAAPIRGPQHNVAPHGGGAKQAVVPRGDGAKHAVVPPGAGIQHRVEPRHEGAQRADGLRPDDMRVVGRPGGPAREPRVVNFNGVRAINAGPLRGVPLNGAGRAFVHGQNFSAWRNGYRIRRGGGWRTFVELSALGAIGVGGAIYYPYAYVSAPESLCDGLSEDGCQMMWEDVETIEGGGDPQCVAYCPWQD